MTNKNAICLVVDRLHAGFLGTMGNSWVRTPTFDRLAGQSLLFDAAIVDRPDLQHLYRAYWQGQHATAPDAGSDESLPSRLQAAGVRSVLLTDEPSVAESDVAAHFSERIVLPAVETTELAASIEETGFARFFVAAIDLVDQIAEPSLIWLHTRGMAAAWDAPLELREAFADEEDPEPLTLTETPCQTLSPDYDPDDLLGITQAYVAQVALWDVCFGTLLDAIDASPAADRTLLNVMGARGFPLGEHLTVGAASDRLYGELLQVPWVLRRPQGHAASVRTSQLVQPSDLFATLCDWWQLDSAESAWDIPPLSESLLKLTEVNGPWSRDRACSVGDGDEWAIRTKAWFECGPSLGDADHAELFAKPDDRFEANEVSDRCVEVTDLLAAAFAEFRQLAAQGREADWTVLAPLDRCLTDGLS